MYLCRNCVHIVGDISCIASLSLVLGLYSVNYQSSNVRNSLVCTVTAVKPAVCSYWFVTIPVVFVHSCTNYLVTVLKYNHHFDNSLGSSLRLVLKYQCTHNASNYHLVTLLIQVVSFMFY